MKTKKPKPPIPLLAKNNFLIDSHCHLDMDSYQDDLDELLKRAHIHGVKSIITIGIDEQSSYAAVNLAKKYPSIKASVGVHPHDAEQMDSGSFPRITELISTNREHVVAYGEIGLDYAKQYSDPAVQRKAFREQLHMAKDLSLPVIIHDREAHDDTLKILHETGPFPAGGVMHCFSGDLALAEQVINLGFYLSIPGVITFKNGKDLQRVAANVPLESLLLETDGPFLAPDPWRGKRNEPAYLPYIAAKIAELRRITIEDVANQTSANTQNLFNYDVAI